MNVAIGLSPAQEGLPPGRQQDSRDRRLKPGTVANRTGRTAGAGLRSRSARVRSGRAGQARRCREVRLVGFDTADWPGFNLHGNSKNRETASARASRRTGPVRCGSKPSGCCRERLPSGCCRHADHKSHPVALGARPLGAGRARHRADHRQVRIVQWMSRVIRRRLPAGRPDEGLIRS